MRFNIEQIVREDSKQVLYLKFDHFSQVHIQGEDMKYNERGQGQGDKLKNLRIHQYTFDVFGNKYHHRNRHQDGY